MSYLVLRGKGEGPLFQFKDGRALTRPLLVSELRKALAEAGLKPENYAGHIFRHGHNCRSMWHPSGDCQDVGPLEEPSLPVVCETAH